MITITIKPNDIGDYIGEVSVIQPGYPNAEWDFTGQEVTKEELMNKIENVFDKISSMAPYV